MLTSVPLKETWNDKLDARLIGSLTGSSHLLLVKRNVRSLIICIGRNIGSDINRQFYNRNNLYPTKHWNSAEASNEPFKNQVWSVKKTSSLFLRLQKSCRSFERSVCAMVSPWIEIGCYCWCILAPKPAFCPPGALKNWWDELSFASELSNWFSLNTSWINNLAWWLFLLCRSDPYSVKSKSLQTSCPLKRTGT